MKNALLVCVVAATLAAPGRAAPNWDAVDRALGWSGSEQPGGIHRYSFPRSDLNVTVDGVAIKPALALGSWAAFEPTGNAAMVMGDLVLTHGEINPVMTHLLSDGFTITALHNHLLRSTPATMYMHVVGHGDAVKLATALRQALALSRTPLAAPSKAPAGSAPPVGLDEATLDPLMGSKGKVNGGVLQYSFPRAEKLMDGGMPVPAPMGTATTINFQATGKGRAAISGDFVMIASEVGRVMRTLQAHGIEVTALHNHMLDDQPRLFFMHFWANRDATGLARGLRAALDKMNHQHS